MREKEWHRDRLEELKFLINQKNISHQNSLFIFGAFLSASLILFIFEFNKESTNNILILVLTILIFVCIWGLVREPIDIFRLKRKIRRNYNVLLERI